MQQRKKQSENITCVSNMYQLRSKSFSIPFFKVYFKLPENIELVHFYSQRGSKSKTGHVCTPNSIPNLCSLPSFQFSNLRFACSRYVNLFNCSCVILNVFRPLHASLVKPFTLSIVNGLQILLLGFVVPFSLVLFRV